MTYTLKLKEERKIGHEAGFREGMEKRNRKRFTKGKVGNCIRDAKRWGSCGKNSEVYRPFYGYDYSVKAITRIYS